MQFSYLKKTKTSPEIKGHRQMSLNFKASRVHCITYSCKVVNNFPVSLPRDKQTNRQTNRHMNATRNNSFFAQNGWRTIGLISTVSLYPQPRNVSVQQSEQHLTTTLECIRFDNYTTLLKTSER